MTFYSNNGRYQAHRATAAKRWPVTLLMIAAVLFVVLCLLLVVKLVWPAMASAETVPHQPSAPVQSDPGPTAPLPTEPTTQPAGPSTQPTEPLPPAPLVLPEQVRLLQPCFAVGEQLRAELLVSGLADTGITVRLEQVQPILPGEQTVTLVFSDGQSSCTQQTTVFGFELDRTATVYAEDAHIPSVSDFIADPSVQASFTAAADAPLTTSGEVVLTITCHGAEYVVSYIVAERQPPVGVPQQVTTQSGILPDPATLLAEIRDDSEVIVTYQQTPDLSVVGEITVELLLTDAYGNTSVVESSIRIIPNENAPQFTGLGKLTVSAGGAISYKSGVTATDPQDGKVSFKVDNSGVDPYTPGTYTAYYSATDSEGNTTIIPRKIVVLDVTEDTVRRYAQQILDRIITPDMTRDQQISAIHAYCHDNVAYVGYSDKSSIVNAAYEGFTTNQGDCYTYYAMNVIFFDLLGIENLEVTRINGTSHHWWNLVLFEDGFYYHVDSCHAKIKPEGFYFGKMTESDLEFYTNHPAVVDRRPNYYVYDKTLPEYQNINIAP